MIMKYVKLNDLRLTYDDRIISAIASVIHVCMLLFGIGRQFLVVDETAHVPAGLFHWKTGEFGLYRVNPPLPRMIAVVPLLFDQSKFDFDRVQANPGTRVDFEPGPVYSSDLSMIEEDRRVPIDATRTTRRSLGHPYLIRGRLGDIMYPGLIQIVRVALTLAFVTIAERGTMVRPFVSYDDRLLALVVRVRAGDRSAREAFAQATLDRLSRRVRSANPREDQDACDSAAAVAIVEFLDHADRYNRDRLDVIDYLFIAAHRNVRDLRRSRRSSSVQKKLGKLSRNFVELDRLDSNMIWRDDDDPAISLERAEERRIAIERIEAIRSRLSTREAIVFDRICQGVHDTETFAKALGIAHLGDQDRRKYVKRFKDRLILKLKQMHGSSSQ